MCGERFRSFRCRWFSAAVAVVFALTSACDAQAARGWGTLTTDRFVAISQLGERDTRAWALDFSRFIASLHDVMPIDERALPPLTVVLFARGRDFAPFKPAWPDGKRADEIAGYFHGRQTWAVIGLAQRSTNAATRQLIQHEGVHWFMSADTRDYPLWFEEGIAEVFATFDVEGDQLRWGALIPAHVAWLKPDELIPLEKLLHVSRASSFFNESDRTSLFYAESWALVHYMLFGKRDGDRSQLESYLAAWRGGENPDDAFRAAFGMDYAGMDAAFARYIESGSFYLRKKRAAPVANKDWRFAPSKPDDVEIALARLALGSGRPELARAHIESLIAREPDRPEGCELLAMLERDLAGTSAGASIRVRDAAERAVALGSRDAQVYEIAATEKWRAATELGGVDGAEARVIADLYERALELRPGLLIALKNLAGIVSLAEPLRPEDERALARGAKDFPNEGKIFVGLATYADRRGDRVEAKRFLDLASSDGRGASAETMQAVNEMRSRWRQRDHFERVAAAMKARHYDEALAAFDELIALTGDVETRTSLINQRRGLAQECLVGAVDDTIAAGAIDIARERITDLLRGDQLQPAARRYLQARLESIGGNRDEAPASTLATSTASEPVR